MANTSAAPKSWTTDSSQKRPFPHHWKGRFLIVLRKGQSAPPVLSAWPAAACPVGWPPPAAPQGNPVQGVKGRILPATGPHPGSLPHRRSAAAQGRGGGI